MQKTVLLLHLDEVLMSSDQIAIKQVFTKLQVDVLLFEKEAQKTRPKSFKMVDKQVIKGAIHCQILYWSHTTTSGNTIGIFCVYFSTFCCCFEPRNLFKCPQTLDNAHTLKCQKVCRWNKRPGAKSNGDSVIYGQP